jgi:hypothetical protein
VLHPRHFPGLSLSCRYVILCMHPVDCAAEVHHGTLDAQSAAGGGRRLQQLWPLLYLSMRLYLSRRYV